MRRTAKNRLIERGIPKDVICKKTGHISNADESYIEKDMFEQQMSSILYGAVPVAKVPQSSMNKIVVNPACEENVLDNSRVTAIEENVTMNCHAAQAKPIAIRISKSAQDFN